MLSLGTAAAGARLPSWRGTELSVPAENYPEEEQSPLRLLEEASVACLHVEAFCLRFDGLPTLVSIH